MSTADKNRRSKSDKDQPAASAVEGVDTGNLDQVRDILFGSHVRDLNGALERVEDRLGKDIQGLRTDGKNRADSLELYVKNELESLVDRINGEQQERARAMQDRQRELKETASELKEMLAALEGRLVKLDEKMVKAERALRQHILDEAKNLREDLQSKAEQQTEALEHQAQTLREAKADRSALGDLFREMAMRITEQYD